MATNRDSNLDINEGLLDAFKGTSLEFLISEDGGLKMNEALREWTSVIQQLPVECRDEGLKECQKQIRKMAEDHDREIQKIRDIGEREPTNRGANLGIDEGLWDAFNGTTHLESIISGDPKLMQLLRLWTYLLQKQPEEERDKRVKEFQKNMRKKAKDHERKMREIDREFAIFQFRTALEMLYCSIFFAFFLFMVFVIVVTERDENKKELQKIELNQENEVNELSEILKEIRKDRGNETEAKRPRSHFEKEADKFRSMLAAQGNDALSFIGNCFESLKPGSSSTSFYYYAYYVTCGAILIFGIMRLFPIVQLGYAELKRRVNPSVFLLINIFVILALFYIFIML